MKAYWSEWWTTPPNKQLWQPHVIIQLPFHYRSDAKEKIAEYYKSGLSLREIQKRGGGSKSKILKTLRDSEVEVRTFKKGNSNGYDLTKVMRSGATPYGYCYLDGQLVMDNREQQIIHRIVEMKANGMSFRGIARALNDQKISTRMGKTWKHEVVKQIIERHTLSQVKTTP